MKNKLSKRVYNRLIYHSSELFRILKYCNHPLFNISCLNKNESNNNLEIDEKTHDEIIERIIVAYHKSKKEQKNAGPPYQLGGE